MRREAEREAERLRVEAAEQLDRALVEAEASVGVHAEELRRRAQRNRERAIARAIAAAVGEAP
jgi:vacuolar-type H+-ATPase subunit E/Vma4